MAHVEIADREARRAGRLADRLKAAHLARDVAVDGDWVLRAALQEGLERLEAQVADAEAQLAPDPAG